MAYTNLSDFMAMREGEADPDDVTIDEPEPASPEPAIAVSDDAERSESVGDEEAPAPSKEDVSEAARVLSQQKNETRREKRTREIQEEINTLTKAKATAKAEADAETGRLATLRAQRAQLEAVKPEAEVAKPVAEKAPLVRPTPPDSSQVGSAEMPDLDAYMAKQAEFAAQMADYSVANAKTVAREAVQEERQRAAHEATATVWQGRVQAAKAKYPDFETVITSDAVAISPDLAGLIMHDPDPASIDVAYYLGTHVEESHRIARLAPLAQAAEYGRLKASAVPQAPSTPKTGPTPSAKPASRTPAPVPPVGVASVSSQVPTERMTLADYVARRNAEEDRNGRL